MTVATFAQAALFADFDQIHALVGRREHVRATERTRRYRVVDHEGAARLLDTSDDYRVLRRLKPREADVLPARARRVRCGNRRCRDDRP